VTVVTDLVPANFSVADPDSPDDEVILEVLNVNLTYSGLGLGVDPFTWPMPPSCQIKVDKNSVVTELVVGSVFTKEDMLIHDVELISNTGWDGQQQLFCDIEVDCEYVFELRDADGNISPDSPVTLLTFGSASC